MVRIEICEGKITIAYGQDHMTGYFLSVSDERLWDSADASDEANAIAFKVTNGAGYFDLRTAPMGFGHRVKLNTLLEYWKRYGVPDLHIQRAQRGEDLEDPVNVENSNQQDANKGSKKKKKKKKKKAKAAQEDLPSTSGTIPSSPSSYPIKIVKGYLLPVNEDKPRLVDVECEVRPPEDGEIGFDYNRKGAEMYLNTSRFERLHITATGKSWVWGCSGPQIEITCRDGFVIDGSPLNRCVRHITKGRALHPWAAAMLVMKSRDGISERYVDVDDEALRAATTFLATYGT